MKKAFHIALMLVPLALQSCSTMKVNVDVLNRAAIEETYPFKLIYYKQIEMEVQAANKNDLKKETLDRAVQFISNHGDVYPVQNRQRLIEQLDSNFENAWKVFQEKKESVLNALASRKSNATTSPDGALAEYAIAKGVLRNMLEGIDDAVLNSLPLSTLNSNLLLQDISKLKAKIETSASQFGESIVDDPIASIVATAPDFYWNKFKSQVIPTTSTDLGIAEKYDDSKEARYNCTIAKTFFGNSDIAIKMENPGVFVVKGVRVDADEAIRSSFKVLAQGIKYMAFASGVPITGADGKKNVRIPEIENYNQQTKVYTSTKAKYERVTEDFLSKVIAIKSDLAKLDKNPKEKDVNDCIERLKTAYEVYKTSLNN